MAREAWTDERLDDLNKKVDGGFREMRGEFKAARVEFKAIRTEMREGLDGVRGEMQDELRGIRAEIGALNRTVIQFAWAVVGTIFLGFMGTIAALITIV